MEIIKLNIRITFEKKQFTNTIRKIKIEVTLKVG